MISRLTGELNQVLAKSGVPVNVVGGAEIVVARAIEMPRERIAALTLGEGPYLLVESPYAPTAPLLDEILFDLQLSGFRPVLAHPERCPAFQSEPDRLRRLIQRGIAVSVNASPIAGAFGSTVRRFGLTLCGDGLVHNVSSDEHSPRRRAPSIGPDFKRAERDLLELPSQMDWLTRAVPQAILAGDDLPARPEVTTTSGASRRRRLTRIDRK